MEEERGIVVTNKEQGKRKSNPLSSLIGVVGGSRGGGIAEFVVFGGALAVAGYFAVASFARNRNNKAKKGGRDNNRPKPKELLLDECGCKGEEDHALHSLLQHSSTQDLDAACGWNSDKNNKSTNNQVTPSALLFEQNLILEEKTDNKPNSEEEIPTSFHYQEIAFSDHSHPESAASSNENGAAEDCLASLFNGPNGDAQEMEIFEPQDGQKSDETESEDNDDIIQDDDDDDDDDGVLRSREEMIDSSKASGCNISLDYNDRPIWPGELVKHEPEPEFKQGYRDNYVCNDCYADDSDYTENEKAMKLANEPDLSKKANFSTMLNDQPSTLRTLVIPTLLLAMLLILVLLTRHESLYDLDEASSVIDP